MKPIQNNDPTNSTTQGPGVTSPESGKASGDTGTRKVDPVPYSEVTREISKAEGHRETKNEVLDGAQPTEGKSVVGANNDGSAEAQLNAILSDDELANCYKSQAKDTYFNASEHAFTKLQSMMEDVDLDDPKKMAKVFKRALKEVRQDLKRFEIDTSDLKVTVTTQNSGPVQLIPFKLKEIDPDLLKELLNKALALTKNAMVQRASDPESIPRETYERKIFSCLNQIPPLLQQVDKKTKATFESSFKLLQFPRVEMHFDASAFRQVEKPQTQGSSAASNSPERLDVENTGDFYNEKEPAEEAEENPENLDSEKLYQQKILKDAQLAYREQIKRNGTEADADQAITKQALLNEEVKAALGSVPYSTFGGEGSQGSEVPVQVNPPLLNEPPVLPSQNKPELISDAELSLFEGVGTTTALDQMDEAQKKLFLRLELWDYLDSDEKLIIKVAPYTQDLRSLIPEAALKGAFKPEGERDGRAFEKPRVLPTFGELAARYSAAVVEKEGLHNEEGSELSATIPPQLLVILDMGDDDASLFRALFAYFTREAKWIHATKDEVCEMIRTEGIAQPVKLAIESGVNQYLELDPQTDVQQALTQKLKELDGQGLLVKRVFESAVASGEFSNGAFNGLAEVLGVTELMTRDVNDPYAFELRNLAKFIVDGLATELEVPISRGNEPGLQWQRGNFGLVVNPDYLGTDF